MTVRGHLGRSLAVGGALAVLGAGVGMTLTDRALGVPAPPAGVTPGTFDHTSTDGPKTIGPDVSSPVIESVISVPSSVTGVVRDVNVTTNLTHSFPGDIDMELEHLPTGTKTKLIVGPRLGALPINGFPNAYNGTVFNDSAGTLATDTGRTTVTPVVPEGALGAFVGVPASGDWVLRIRDLADGDQGTFQSWRLSLATQNTVPPLTNTAASSTGGPVAIPDNSTSGVSSTIAVSGAKGYLWDVNLRTNISHAQIDDLVIRLTHVPSGRTTEITRRNTRSFPFFQDRLFDDSAADLVTQGDTEGSLIPEGALAAFMGIDPNGQWRLDVFDLAAGDTGTLDGWSLEIKSTDPASPPGPGTDPGPGAPAPGGTISADNLCLPVTPPASKPSGGNPGKVEVSVRQLQINQRIFQAAVRRANAIQAWLDAGVVERDICGGAISAAKLGPGITTGVLAQAQSLTPPNPRPVTPARAQAKRNVKFELTAAQFLINQRVAQAAVRRANALQARLDGGLTGGDVRDGSITQGKLNAGLAILSAQPGGQPQAATRTVIAKGSGGDPGRVKVDAAQLLISQRIGQAAIRRLNALTARLQAGLRTGDFRDASLSAADLSQDLRN